LSRYLDDPRYTITQKQLILDGNVTRAELLQAADAYNTCMVDATGTGVTVTFEDSGRYQISGSRPGGMTADAFHAAKDSCELANFQAAGFVYDFNSQESPAQRQLIDELAARCLSAAGIDPNSELSDEELTIEADCYEEAASGH
jgi:hypothetical protein